MRCGILQPGPGPGQKIGKHLGGLTGKRKELGFHFVALLLGKLCLVQQGQVGMDRMERTSQVMGDDREQPVTLFVDKLEPDIFFLDKCSLPGCFLFFGQVFDLNGPVHEIGNSDQDKKGKVYVNKPADPGRVPGLYQVRVNIFSHRKQAYNCNMRRNTYPVDTVRCDLYQEVEGKKKGKERWSGKSIIVEIIAAQEQVAGDSIENNGRKCLPGQPGKVIDKGLEQQKRTQNACQGVEPDSDIEQNAGGNTQEGKDTHSVQEAMFARNAVGIADKHVPHLE